MWELQGPITLPAPRSPVTLWLLLEIGVLVEEWDWIGDWVVVVDVVVPEAVLRRQPRVHQPFLLVHVFSLTLTSVALPQYYTSVLLDQSVLDLTRLQKDTLQVTVRYGTDLRLQTRQICIHVYVLLLEILKKLLIYLLLLLVHFVIQITILLSLQFLLF